MKQDYYVYILTNKHKSVLYVGVTNSLKRRIHEHCTGRNLGFTNRYNVKHLIYYEQFVEIDQALKREKEIKGWTRIKKNELIESINPEWKFINVDNGK